MIERIGTGPIILDASAALAVILGERRARALTGEILRRSVISTVNLAEVQSKLVRAGYDPEIAWEDALSVTAAVEPYTAEQAKIAAHLSRKLSAGLVSRRPVLPCLGDRSKRGCLHHRSSLAKPPDWGQSPHHSVAQTRSPVCVLRAKPLSPGAAEAFFGAHGVGQRFDDGDLAGEYGHRDHLRDLVPGSDGDG